MCIRDRVYFGSAYRAKSKRLGLWVTLCPWCHQNGPTAIHNNRDADLRLKCWAQKKAMEHYGWPEARFIQEFGRDVYKRQDQVTPLGLDADKDSFHFSFSSLHAFLHASHFL